jgi:hypothetical protein
MQCPDLLLLLLLFCFITCKPCLKSKHIYKSSMIHDNVFIQHGAVVSLFLSWSGIERVGLILPSIYLHSDMHGRLYFSTASDCISLYLHCCTECVLWALSQVSVHCYSNLSCFLQANSKWVPEHGWHELFTQHNNSAWRNHSGRWQSDTIVAHALGQRLSSIWQWKKRTSGFWSVESLLRIMTEIATNLFALFPWAPVYVSVDKKKGRRFQFCWQAWAGNGLWTITNLPFRR